MEIRDQRLGAFGARSIRLCLPAMVVVTALLSAACSSSSEAIQVASEGSCARRYTFEGLMYEDYTNGSSGDRLKIGKKLGTAHVPPCNDTPNQAPSQYVDDPVTVYQIRGLSAESAIAVDTGGKRMELFATRTEDGKRNPDVLQFLEDQGGN